MLVSWNWLKDFVELDMEPAELEHRLSMSGLNHEGSTTVGDDLAIDLEVTSNRPDCLGHIGVAREIAVLWGKMLTVPAPAPEEGSTSASELIRVRIDCPELCPRYTARVVRGIKVGPSPKWLTDRLATVNIAAINNIVDITNYVLMECGQPLHAFDYRKLSGAEIIVREALTGEEFTAIDHNAYVLEPGMCVIADARRSVALGGVMGGLDTEISDDTTDLLVEAADFAQLSIRNTARRLNLHSDSSYRFERGVDPDGIDWASRRCCEIILDLAGGELASGVVDVVGHPAADRPLIVLRLSQIPRVLGIEVDRQEVHDIFSALGLKEEASATDRIELRAPSWRRDLTREVDLIEEVARIHGYEEIPEDARVAMAISHRSDEDRVLGKVRDVLTAAGFDEAMTTSVVSAEWSEAFSPWTDVPAIACRTPMLRGADQLRRSIVPSLLQARRLNETLSNSTIELFETAKVYLPRPGNLPDERWMLAITSGEDFLHMKGTIESMLTALKASESLDFDDFQHQLLETSRTVRILYKNQWIGILGELSAAGRKQFDLRGPSTVAELHLDALRQAANLVPQYVPASAFPAIVRDLNMVVDESLRWNTLVATVREASGRALESVSYRETYRDAEHDGVGKKRLLFSLTLRSPDRTLAGDEADALCEKVVRRCQDHHGARLLA
jgi:phenylalanyl-tRNA synthetase beta chain